MSTRLDAVTVRNYVDSRGETKAKFTNIGSAWETKNGGWSIVLDALPVAQLNDKGALETRILLMQPKASDDRPAQNGSRARAPAFASGAQDDDAIPFFAEFRG